jgi:hypothetical protein
MRVVVRNALGRGSGFGWRRGGEGLADGYILMGVWWGMVLVGIYHRIFSSPSDPVYLSLLPLSPISSLAINSALAFDTTTMVLKTLQSSQEQQLPWVETPLRESYALSQAAGWYGHSSSQHRLFSTCSLRVRDSSR